MNSLIGSAARLAARCQALAIGAAIFWGLLSPAVAQFVGSGEIRPFVVGVVPVVGRSGAVGGVSIDARGVVARCDF